MSGTGSCCRFGTTTVSPALQPQWVPSIHTPRLFCLPVCRMGRTPPPPSKLAGGQWRSAPWWLSVFFFFLLQLKTAFSKSFFLSFGAGTTYYKVTFFSICCLSSTNAHFSACLVYRSVLKNKTKTFLPLPTAFIAS